MLLYRCLQVLSGCLFYYLQLALLALQGAIASAEERVKEMSSEEEALQSELREYER